MSSLVVASGSPRRHRLLRAAGYRFEIAAPDVDESPRPGESPAALVLRLAHAKAATVPSSAVVLAADTVVVLGQDILGKPTDAAEAVAMLTRLSGSTHQVMTGWVVRAGGATAASGVETTHVGFRRLLEDEILDYVGGGEPLDKAGAYAIQGGAAEFVERLDGSHSNVVGLPMEAVTEALAILGVEPSQPPG